MQSPLRSTRGDPPRSTNRVAPQQQTAARSTHQSRDAGDDHTQRGQGDLPQQDLGPRQGHACLVSKRHGLEHHSPGSDRGNRSTFRQEDLEESRLSRSCRNARIAISEIEHLLCFTTFNSNSISLPCHGRSSPKKNAKQDASEKDFAQRNTVKNILKKSKLPMRNGEHAFQTAKELQLTRGMPGLKTR